MTVTKFGILCKKRVYLKLEKVMAPHSSTLAWKIPWKEGPDGLQSVGLLGVGHDWATSLYFFTFMHWRRKWQPTPVFLPGESQGRGSLVGCRLWGRTESDTTEVTWQQQQFSVIVVSVCLPSDALLQHLPSYLGFSYLRHGVSLHGCSSKVQPLLLTLDEGYLPVNKFFSTIFLDSIYVH